MRCPAVKIASFNINGINGRLPILLGWLAEAAPDVVCLQELKAMPARFPHAALAAAGYGAVWQGQKSWNGVAILARGREPIETRRGLPGDLDGAGSRYIEAAVGGVLVGCIYAPNGNPVPGPKWNDKLGWFERFLAHAADLRATDAPVVLAGDYNIIPTERDVVRPERWRNDALFRPEVRAIFARLLEAGWVDAVRQRFPDGPVYTFWDYLRNAWERDAGLRLDHLLLTPDLAARLVDAGVDRAMRGRAGASDHAPVWIQLAPPPRRRVRTGSGRAG